MLFISIQELEAAINYWRDKSPSSGESLVLCSEASCLAKSYALMIIQSAQRIPLEGLSEAERVAFQVYLANKG
ncbi:DUF3717 domain-containing protein [Polynucleobacter sp. 30F-ANTBAC]|jgi:Protein of unknown function (DUF3717)|uniref:DUF3717 domain-containing protein n=1 Tax=Polynucleobacter sp. 30F-ANTBAC TaxID=2689095 RepID=UPI001C0B609A|nr:DUF3717 domain-containing protein [Polynucleobacter sp. 30F-ANTBAC]MBU3600014.1 DUF3717 domain-containing protein [Polynucleobacter sp. 30F-ANTBAC]